MSNEKIQVIERPGLRGWFIIGLPADIGLHHGFTTGDDAIAASRCTRQGIELGRRQALAEVDEAVKSRLPKLQGDEMWGISWYDAPDSPSGEQWVIVGTIDGEHLTPTAALLATQDGEEDE